MARLLATLIAATFATDGAYATDARKDDKPALQPASAHKADKKEDMKAAAPAAAASAKQ